MTRPTLDDPSTAAAVVLLTARGYCDREIGEALGVSRRTAARWRSLLGIASTWTPQPLPCGTRASYAAGCRCTPCTHAHAAYHRARRRQAAYARWRTAVP